MLPAFALRIHQAKVTQGCVLISFRSNNNNSNGMVTVFNHEFVMSYVFRFSRTCIYSVLSTVDCLCLIYLLFIPPFYNFLVTFKKKLMLF